MRFRLSSHAAILFLDYWKFVRNPSIIRQRKRCQKNCLFRLGKTGKGPRHHRDHQAEHNPAQDGLQTESHQHNPNYQDHNAS